MGCELGNSDYYLEKQTKTIGSRTLENTNRYSQTPVGPYPKYGKGLVVCSEGVTMGKGVSGGNTE